MIFKRYHYDATGCAAYLFGCGGRGLCAVVDPHEEDIEAYARFAAAKGMRITHVIDTHVQADHRSGGRALAEHVGAKYCLHASAEVGFAFEPLVDGQRLELGNAVIQVLHTPGHTPESLCLVVSDLRRGPEPWFVLTGDTLFVGAVGRPDLPGDAAANAARLHASLHEKLLRLPGDVEVYPAHYAGSACGAGLSGKPASTLAAERRWNRLLTLSREDFVKELTQGMPDKAAGMADVVRFNSGRAP
jgi:hydroxyacylglutathione hydrolase